MTKKELAYMADGAVGVESVNLLLHTHWLIGAVAAVVSFASYKLLQSGKTT